MSFGSLPSVLGNGGGVAISVIGGTGLFADGTAAAPSISFSADSDTGFYRTAANTLGFSSAGSLGMRFSGSAIYGATFDNYLFLDPNGTVAIVAAGTNKNITLTPSGTGLVDISVAGGLRLSVAAAPILLRSSGSDYVGVRLNGTGTGFLEFSGGTVYPAGYKFYISPSTGLFVNGSGRTLLGTETDSGNGILQLATHTTSTGGIGFGTDTSISRYAAGAITLSSAQTNTLFSFSNSSGNTGQIGFYGSNLQLLADAGSIILKTGTTAALTLDAAQNATFAASVNVLNTAAIRWTSWTQMLSPADGVIRFCNAAGTDFNRLQFGGTTNLFPSLKRVSAALSCVLADDSSFATFRASDFSAQSAATVVGANQISYGGTTATTVGAAGGASLLPATPLGYIIVNVGGTTAKVPYYNS